MQIPLGRGDEDDGALTNGYGMDDSKSLEEKKEDVSERVAGVVQALTELASVQTPASVWLPSKHLTVQLSGKVEHCRTESLLSAA